MGRWMITKDGELAIGGFSTREDAENFFRERELLFEKGYAIQPEATQEQLAEGWALATAQGRVIVFGFANRGAVDEEARRRQLGSWQALAPGEFDPKLCSVRYIATPDASCITTPDGGCASDACMHSVKPTNPKDYAATTRVPLWLLSPIAKAHWALAQLAGLIKYGAWNWREAGVRASVYLSAAQRHLDAYTSGEEFDPVDGTHHLGNVMACAAILLDAKEAGKLTDDRPPSVGLRGTYAWAEKLAAKLFEQYRDRAPRHYTIGDTKP